MKRSHLFALGLIVATCTVGCGTENPTGPSFARTAPPTETTAWTMPISEDPGANEDGPGTTMPEVTPPDGEAPRKAKNPNYKRGHEHAPGLQSEVTPEDPIELP